ncbi:uncharacterized protein LOC124266863 isoform X2 [Haliotis rubra]|uniref:uncharacterized protein LOC124266863 isoform X2 n=1 Tax=Haliotis rubra TaxID=36100 RepID=UPI001EE5B7A8|nr:uncharacterized protein LOC124266863 isoform X2 [Haliotis rubra]
MFRLFVSGSMLVVIFLCCLHLVVLQAVPREVADPLPPRDGIRYSRSSGSENAVKDPNHVPEFLPFSKNAEGVPQLSIKKIRDSLGKPTKQPDTVVKQNKLPNLDGLTMEQIKQKYGPVGNKPQPNARNPPPGMDKRHVSPAFPRSPVGKRAAKDEH